MRDTGTVRYFCDCGRHADPACVPGDDARAGTSPSSPRRSLAAALSVFRSMAAGDTVALCRGGAWNGAIGGIHNVRCRGERPCDFRDYVPPWGTPGTARPRIELGSGTGFAMVQPGHTEGYRYWNLDLRHDDLSSGETFVFTEDVTDVDVCNVRLEGGRCGFNVQPRNAGPSRITLRQNEVRGYGFSGFYGGANGLVLDANRFESNGLLGRMLDHSIYVNGIHGGIRGPRITNNEIRTDARCGGVMIVAHEKIEDLVIENNLLANEGGNEHCYGIQSAGSWAVGDLSGLRVSRNRVIFRRGGGGTAIEVSTCRGCVVSDNVVHTPRSGISVGTTVGPNNPPTRDVVVQNNSVYSTGRGVGVTVGADPSNGADFIVENNAVWTDGTCFRIGRPTARLGHNHCRERGGPPASSLWMDAARGDFRPVARGPLAGSADPAHFSPTAIGSVEWSPADAGVRRTPPADIGAFERD